MDKERVDELVDQHTKWFVSTIKKIYWDAMKHGYKHGYEDGYNDAKEELENE